MPVFAALLRAVNVGGANKVPMAELREALTKAGYRDVATYIQSGNVVLSHAKKTDDDVARDVKRVIAKEWGHDVGVVVRSHAELAAIAKKGHGYGEVPPNRVHVVFLSGAPTKAAIAALDPNRSPPDVYEVRGQELYWHTPDGAGKSKVSMDWLERKLGVVGTARNWNTVLKLEEMTRA